MADGVDIDIYAEVEHDFQEGDYSSGGNPNNSGNGSADLYDDILTNNGGSHSGVGDFPPELNSKGNDVPTGVSSNYTGKRVALYVGNMTWWTTDQDLTNSINVLGVNDLLEIKFYENRVNGQSKGFAVVTVGSDGSSRIVMDKLPTKELHGQHPIVTHCNRQALTQFEAQARKENPQDSRNRFRNQRNQQGQGPPGPQQQQQQPLPPPPPPQFHPPGGPMRNGQRNMGPPLRLQGNMPNMPPNMHLHPGGPPMVTPLAMRGPLGPRPPMPGQHLGPRPDWGDRGHQGHHHPQHHPHQHHPHHVGPPGGLNLGPGPQMPGPPTAHSHAHVNPAFFPQPPGLRPELAFDPNRGGDPYYRPPGRPDQGHGGPPMSEQEFAEIMERNKSVSSSAIARAVQDAAAGEYASAIETLVTAISLIKQSKVANDDRCRILITSLQDTLKGIEDKSYGSRTRSRSRERSRHRSRSRDRDSRERDRRHRHRSRSHERDYSRGRSRERFYEERASHHRRY